MRGAEVSVLAVELAIMHGLADVVGTNSIAIFEVGDRSGNPQDLVVGAGRKAKFGHRLLENAFARGVQRAMLAYQPRAHPGIEHSLFLAETATLALACCE